MSGRNVHKRPHKVRHRTPHHARASWSSLVLPSRPPPSLPTGLDAVHGGQPRRYVGLTALSRPPA
eukprot:3386-Eustigmatos_ZCMA.PRE.1